MTFVELHLCTDMRTQFCESDLSSLSAFESYGVMSDSAYVAQTLECQDLGDMRLIRYQTKCECLLEHLLGVLPSALSVIDRIPQNQPP